MPLGIIKIGIPAYPFYTNKFGAVFIDPATCGFQRITVRNTEFAVSTVNTGTKPYLIGFDKWKNLSTGDFEILPVTSNVSYEAMYIKTPIPPKEPTTALQISAPVLNKLAYIAFVGGFVLLVAIPCVIIIAVKIAVRVQRKAPRERRKNKK